MSVYWSVMVVGAEQDDVVVSIAFVLLDLADASRSAVAMRGDVGLLTHNHGLIELGRIYQQNLATVGLIAATSRERP